MLLFGIPSSFDSFVQNSCEQLYQADIVQLTEFMWTGTELQRICMKTNARSESIYVDQCDPVLNRTTPAIVSGDKVHLTHITFGVKASCL